MTWTEAEAEFAKNFAAYEPRLPQRSLALAIEDALGSGAHLFAQAPCGVGKSYAGAVPAIDHAAKTGMPVAMAPGTKALQDQYIRDMETLKRIYRDFSYVVVKGRSNYVCRAKLDKLDETLLGLDQAEITKAAEQEGVNGDLDRLGIPLSPLQRANLAMGADECPGKKRCPFGEVCFAEKIKQKAQLADVVIVNHALLSIDAVLRAKGISMLPGFSAIVVDEAQEFEGYATNALSATISAASFLSLVTEVANFLADRSLIEPAASAVNKLFAKLQTVFDNRADKRERALALSPGTLLELREELLGVQDALNLLDGKVSIAPTHTDEDALRKLRLTKRLNGALEKVLAVVVADFSEWVRWIEEEEKNNYRTGETTRRIVLSQAPLDVAPFLAAAIWENQPTVFMSATLAIGDDFSYLARKLGVGEYRTFDCESPFDFATQAVTYIAKDMPDPSREAVAFRTSVNLQLTELVRASDGRALLLFTSIEGMNSAHRAVGPVIESMGHRVFKQGQAGARELAEAFKNDEHSVLFATKSFFTGVDIQGDSLRLVVIDKFPFPIKEPLFAARCDAHDATLGPRDKFAKGSFMTMWVPEMIITLLQGFGRGIRSRSDRALIAILDPRAYSKPSYGRQVLKVLPPAPQVTTLPEAIAYLHSLEGVPA